MEPGFEDKYHSLEGSHWWFLARRRFILSLVERMPRGSRVLEAGCSGGLLLEALSKNGFASVKGIDISSRAVALCRKRGLDADVADAQATGFPDGSFDVVIASDVLEHIEDERRALSEWKRVLKPGGTLISFVPAFDFLWSGHDEANRHLRRYSKSRLLSALSNAGFSVVRCSYWNILLFLPASLYRLTLAKLVKRKDDLSLPPGPINSLLLKLLSAENRILSSMDPPFGVSLFAIAKK